MRVAAIGLAAMLAGVAAPAAGCGYCIEDRIAAAYDHGVAAQAQARGHEVVYVALEFAQPITAGEEDAIRRAIELMPFVDHGSVRVARDAGSASLAFDPRRAPAGGVLRELDRAFSALGARMTLLQFGRRG